MGCSGSVNAAPVRASPSWREETRTGRRRRYSRMAMAVRSRIATPPIAPPTAGPTRLLDCLDVLCALAAELAIETGEPVAVASSEAVAGEVDAGFEVALSGSMDCVRSRTAMTIISSTDAP